MDLALGHAAAGNLWSVFERKFEPFPDAMSWGPAGTFSPVAPEPWIRERLSYWIRLASPVKQVTAKSFIEYLRVVDAIRRATELTIWMAHDLDSLVLAAWVAILHHTFRTGCQIHLVRFPQKAGHHIGTMPAEVLQSFSTPEPIRSTTFDFLLAFWDAWSASTPQPLIELVRENTDGEASRQIISAWMDRYPSAKTGLSHWDHTLLYAVRDYGPSLASIIANVYSDSLESSESAGDVWLKARLCNLARSPVDTPLVTIDQPNPKRTYIGNVYLTAAGDQILSGEISVLGRYWPNDWIGGVRLSAPHPFWVRTHDGLAEWNAPES